MASKLCLDCDRIFKGPGARCTDCTRAKSREREKTRATPAERGYGHAWRVLRKQILDRDGHQCTRCGTAGTGDNPLSVDHIMAKTLGGTDDPSNLTTLCRRCHGKKGPQVSGRVGGTG
jgi:5-methylcytosine-specific restriction protein A